MERGDSILRPGCCQALGGGAHLHWLQPQDQPSAKENSAYLLGKRASVPVSLGLYSVKVISVPHMPPAP